MADQILYDMPTVLDQNAQPVANGSIEVYEQNTTTPVSLVDASGDPLGNPISLDAAGRPSNQVFYAGGTAVDIVIKDSSGVQLRQIAQAPRLSSADAAAANVTLAPVSGNAATNVQQGIANNTSSITALEGNRLQVDLTGQAGKGIFVNAAATQAAYATVGSIFGSYGGTANAITLVTGLGLNALTPGMRFSAICTASNTGATTIAIDNVPAAPVYTADATGATALPSGYIRTDTITEFEVNPAGNLIARRQKQKIEAASGVSYRYEDGTQESFRDVSVSASINTAFLGGFRSLELIFTLPAAQVSLLHFDGTPTDLSAASIVKTNAVDEASLIRYAFTSTTSQSSATRTAKLYAKSTWY